MFRLNILSKVLIVIGVLIFGATIALPSFAPDSPFVAAYMGSLLCSSGDIFTGETTRSVDIWGKDLLSPHGYCVSASGARRDVTDTHVAIGLIGGVGTAVVGFLLHGLNRFFNVFFTSFRMGKNSRDLPFNPTNPNPPNLQ